MGREGERVGRGVNFFTVHPNSAGDLISVARPTVMVEK